MSKRKPEKFWIEFKVFSDIRKELMKIKIDDSELDDYKDNPRRILSYVMRREKQSALFERRTRVYLKETIAQVLQEVEIESSPLQMKLFLGKKADRILSKFLSVHGLKVTEKKNVKRTKEDRLQSLDEQNFKKQLKKKASFSELDKAIVFNEDKLDALVYLFEKQTILKNSVFFDLFQHWFDTPLKAEKIDELIYHLKRKAGLIKPGPKGFSDEEEKRIIFRYEYLRRIFSKLKKLIKEPKDEYDSEKEWKKLETFFEKNDYFQIDKDKVVTIEKWRKYKPSKYIPQVWLKQNFSYFKEIFKHDMTEGEAKDEIKIYIKDKIEHGEEESLKKRGIESFLKFSSLIAMKDTEPSDLAFFLLSKILKTTKRQIRRVVDSNSKTTHRVSKVFSHLPEFN